MSFICKIGSIEINIIRNVITCLLVQIILVRFENCAIQFKVIYIVLKKISKKYEKNNFTRSW